MKKFVQFGIASFFLAASLAPSAVFAAVGQDCSFNAAVCGSGEQCNGFTCQSLGGGGSGSGGLNTTQINGFANQIKGLINTVLVPLLMAVAFIVFLFGVFNYFILGAADEGKRETGRTFVLYGIAGFVIIVSMWGIVFIVVELFGLGGGHAPGYPTL